MTVLDSHSLVALTSMRVSVRHSRSVTVARSPHSGKPLPLGSTCGSSSLSGRASSMASNGQFRASRGWLSVEGRFWASNGI